MILIFVCKRKPLIFVIVLKYDIIFYIKLLFLHIEMIHIVDQLDKFLCINQPLIL